MAVKEFIVNVGVWCHFLEMELMKMKFEKAACFVLFSVISSLLLCIIFQKLEFGCS